MLGGFAEEFLEVFEGGCRGERRCVQDLRFVAGFCADERSGLEAALEGARGNEIELDVQCVQYLRELEALLFAFFVERAFQVEYWIRASQTGAGVAKDVQIHSLFTFYRRRVSDG